MRKKGSIQDITDIKEKAQAKTALIIARDIGHLERTKNIAESTQGQVAEKDMESIGNLQVLQKDIIKSTIVKRFYIINGRLQIWNHIEGYLKVLQIVHLTCKGLLLILTRYCQIRLKTILQKVVMIILTNRCTLDLQL
jgi:hypothetical protein